MHVFFHIILVLFVSFQFHVIFVEEFSLAHKISVQTLSIKRLWVWFNVCISLVLDCLCVLYDFSFSWTLVWDVLDIFWTPSHEIYKIVWIIYKTVFNDMIIIYDCANIILFHILNIYIHWFTYIQVKLYLRHFNMKL